MWESADDLSRIRLRSFRFRIGVTEFHSPADLVQVTDELRSLAKRYPQLEIVTYQQSRAIADQVPLIVVAVRWWDDENRNHNSRKILRQIGL